MSLNDWHKAGWLTKHPTSKQEIADLLAVADRDVTDCQVTGLSPDWQLNIAYNAALQVATAALAAAGYRAGREAHHYRVIQSLAFTLGSENALVIQFEQFRKKRNIGGYERAGTISDQEAREMIALAKRLRGEVQAWLKTNHPKLV